MAKTRKEIAAEIMAIKDDPFITSAAAITPEVEKFVGRLGGGKPVFVRVESQPNAPTDECFPLVLEKVKTDGGELVYGWTIWEWPTIFLDAEHHGVWRSPSGELVDISPKVNGEKRILFVPDPARPHTGIRIDNRRMPLRTHPSIKEKIGLHQRFQKLIGFEVGEYKATEEMAVIQFRIAELDLQLRAMTPRSVITAARAAAGR